MDTTNNQKNLYINPKYYNTGYNYYNYHKFNQTGQIYILYKTPSIFLNGIYFELPYLQIIEISKHPNDNMLKLKLAINNDDRLHVQSGFLKPHLNSLNEYNKTFFESNIRKLDVKTRYTSKNQTYFSKFEQPANKPKNPFVKTYSYIPFIENLNSFQMCMTVNIKCIYLIKICELIKTNIATTQMNTNLLTICDKILDFINQDDIHIYNIAGASGDTCEFNMKFWIKSNYFQLIGNNAIHMIWDVCNYAI